MKVLLVNGSPNANGCTYTALMECAKGIKAEGGDYELFHIGKAAIRGCIGCGGCFKAGKCVFNDDVCNTLAEKMSEADGIIIGSPVYFASANGTLCALLDRIFFSSGRSLKKKPAACVVSCRRGGASAAFDRLNKYFTINEMPVVSSHYWNSVHGSSPEDILKDKEGLRIMRSLGKNMIHMIKSYAIAKLPYPEEEPWEKTDFSHGK